VSEGLYDDDELRAAREKARERRRQVDDDLRAVCALPAGRRFLAGLLHGCGLFEDPATLDGAALAYHKGRRSVGIVLANQLRRLSSEDSGHLVADTWHCGAPDPAPEASDE
jgi:hypothetical protein